MEHLSLNRVRKQVFAATSALALSSVVLFAQDAAPAAGQRSDGQIEMDVVQALDASQQLKNDLITAATIQSQVTLSGTVANDGDRQLAESIVRKVQGVTGVKNNLKVGNPADDPNAQGAPTDDGSMAEDQNEPPQGEPGAGPGQGDTAQGQAPPPPSSQQPQYGGQQGPYGQQPPPNQQPGYPSQPGYPPPPPGYGQGYPPPPPGYGRQPYSRPAPQYSVATAPITVPQRTVLQLRTNDSLDSKRAQDGTPIDFTLIRDVTVNGYLAIPRGATFHGVVTESKTSGQFAGRPELALRLTSMDLGGRSYPLSSDEFRVKGPSKTAHTAGNVIGGALLGALIGGAAGGGGGAAIGAAAGGTIGTAASGVTRPTNAWIPAEALVSFHLNAPITVDPVSQEEANRLAQGLYPGGPQLYPRGYGYARYPRYAGFYGGYGYYGYPYAPVYYRPYYMVGGYYYWR